VISIRTVATIKIGFIQNKILHKNRIIQNHWFRIIYRIFINTLEEENSLILNSTLKSLPIRNNVYIHKCIYIRKRRITLISPFANATALRTTRSRTPCAGAALRKRAGTAANTRVRGLKIHLKEKTTWKNQQKFYFYIYNVKTKYIK